MLSAYHWHHTKLAILCEHGIYFLASLYRQKEFKCFLLIFVRLFIDDLIIVGSSMLLVHLFISCLPQESKIFGHTVFGLSACD